jgi:hypothetical protein
VIRSIDPTGTNRVALGDPPRGVSPTDVPNDKTYLRQSVIYIRIVTIFIIIKRE